MSQIIKSICDEVVEDLITRKQNNFDENYEFQHKKNKSSNIISDNISIYVQNTWCVPAISLDLKERFEKLKEIIKEEEYDVIIFLEVWIQSYREELIKESENTSYNHYSYGSGIGMPIWKYINGSGMMIFSKLEILDCKHHKYSVNGIPHKIEHSDYFGGKGIGLCRLLSSDNKMIDLYVTHLHSTYENNHQDYLATRTIQMYELCEFIKDTHDWNSLCLLLGDLNTSDGQLPFEFLKSSFNDLKDCWLEYNKDKKIEYLSSCTFENPENTYRNGKELPQRLDYIFYVNNVNNNWLLKNCKIEKKYCKNGKSLSDHFGLSVIFENDKIDEIKKERINSVNESIISCENENEKKILKNMKEVIEEEISIENNKSKSNMRNGILLYITTLLLILIYGNKLNKPLLLICYITPIYSIYMIIYSSLILANDIRQFRELINQLNFKIVK